MTDAAHISGRTRRRPVEAIEHRTRRSVECEQRVRRAITKLTKAGAPFTVENVCDLAGVGKTFIYDKRHPALTKLVLTARDASQQATVHRAEEAVGWRHSVLAGTRTQRRSRRQDAARCGQRAGYAHHGSRRTALRRRWHFTSSTKTPDSET